MITKIGMIKLAINARRLLYKRVKEITSGKKSKYLDEIDSGVYSKYTPEQLQEINATADAYGRQARDITKKLDTYVYDANKDLHELSKLDIDSKFAPELVDSINASTDALVKRIKTHNDISALTEHGPHSTGDKIRLCSTPGIRDKLYILQNYPELFKVLSLKKHIKEPTAVARLRDNNTFLHEAQEARERVGRPKKYKNLPRNNGNIQTIDDNVLYVQNHATSNIIAEEIDRLSHAPEYIRNILTKALNREETYKRFANIAGLDPNRILEKPLTDLGKQRLAQIHSNIRIDDKPYIFPYDLNLLDKETLKQYFPTWSHLNRVPLYK